MLLPGTWLQCVLPSFDPAGCRSICPKFEPMAAGTVGYAAQRLGLGRQDDPRLHRHGDLGRTWKGVGRGPCYYGSEGRHPALRTERRRFTTAEPACVGWQSRHRRCAPLSETHRPHHCGERRRLSFDDQSKSARAATAGPGSRRRQLPPFVHTDTGHGRLEERSVSLAPVEPMAVDFPFAPSLLIVKAHRTENKSARTSTETRYYLSSLEGEERTAPQWLEVVRGHWAGVENRNHWRRDACLGEDRTRSRNTNLLINLALLRSTLLRLLNHFYPGRGLPDLTEAFALNPSLSLRLISNRL